MRLTIVLILFIFGFFVGSCREIENPRADFGEDYQPLEVGLFWIYEVEETIVFGENDSQTESFFIRDIIDYSYRNAENQEIFVINRAKSRDRINWDITGSYAMQIVRRTLVRNFENQLTINLVFPPELSKSWDAMALSAANPDEFQITFMGNVTVGEQTFQRSLRVVQEEDDDEITFRDNRYEVFTKGIGLVEQYYEVFTYCSRNDCLGQMILDSGRKTHLKIIMHGKI